MWPPVVFFLLFLLVWELAYRSGWKEPYALPSPADVGLDLREQLGNGRLLGAMQTSLQRGGLGFLVAVAIGTPLGLLIARVRLVRRGLGPFISGLQSLPSVAWVPFAIIFFGIGDAAIYTVVLLGAVPSIANGMVSGVDQVPPLYTRVGQVLGAKGLADGALRAAARPRCPATSGVCARAGRSRGARSWPPSSSSSAPSSARASAPCWTRAASCPT